MRAEFIAYSPLHTPKPFGADLWIVDGPEIGMRYMGLTLPFPTRMTVIRLPDGELWIHSPIAWDDALAIRLAEIGRVRHLVAPNSLHYWHIPDWQARYPDARSYGAPGLQKTARRRLRIDETLGEQPAEAWAGVIDQCVAPGTLLTEVEFFHRPSRTLVLTDLVENFELFRVKRRLWRALIQAFGAADPDGKAPLDMQWSFRRHKPQVRAAVERMIQWAPEQIVLAHGRCYTQNAVGELRRAFRWVF